MFPLHLTQAKKSVHVDYTESRVSPLEQTGFKPNFENYNLDFSPLRSSEHSQAFIWLMGRVHHKLFDNGLFDVLSLKTFHFHYQNVTSFRYKFNLLHRTARINFAHSENVIKEMAKPP